MGTVVALEPIILEKILMRLPIIAFVCTLGNEVILEKKMKLCTDNRFERPQSFQILTCPVI